ncbi:ThiF family adenylyltransferase [Actinotalea sp.]|uniref:ThiF family adenylyltransferase n=1 Tax=Actinotalea sp. TaxID=1872145 RepID=UPI003567F3E6
MDADGAQDPGTGTRTGRLAPLVEPGPALSADDVARFSRHLLLPRLGDLGQRRLRNARVCVVGAGGLGAPVLQYLAAAGVGTIGIVDSDVVELSNLQRQVIHGVADLGRPKALNAADAVAAIDPAISVVVHHLRLTEANVDLLSGYDLVIDGTDNFATRYLVNDACVRLGLPEVWGSVLRFDAQVSVFWGRPPRGSGAAPVQLRDLFPRPPEEGSVPSCAEAGVLGALCGQVGSTMATEAVKLITGIGRPLLGRVAVLDALDQRWAEVPLVGAGRPPGEEEGRARAGRAERGRAPEDRCAAVGGGAAGHGGSAVHGGGSVPVVSPETLADLLSGDPAPVVLDVREPAEHATGTIPGSVLLPLADLLSGDHLDALPADRAVVVLCRSGVRSEVAVRYLQGTGRAGVANLEGGMLAWAARTNGESS